MHAMRRSLRTGFVLAFMTASVSGGAQPRFPVDTVLFICEHGTVKSLFAKLEFERLAREEGWSTVALSRGSSADAAVPPWMQRALAGDGFSLGAWQPKQLTARDIAGAQLIVSFDLPAGTLPPGPVPRLAWDGLPGLSQDYAKGRDAIRARVRQLVDSIRTVSTKSPRRSQSATRTP